MWAMRVEQSRNSPGAEDVVEKEGVGAGPAAPDAAKERGDKKQGETESRDAEEQYPEVLDVKADAEDVKFPVGDVEEDGGVAVDGNPRQGGEDQEDEKSDDPPCGGESPGDVGGMELEVRSVLVDGGDGVEVRCFLSGFGHRDVS